MHNDNLTSLSIPSRTLEFVMQPKSLPPIDGHILEEYLEICRDYVTALIGDALRLGALPERTVLVQCVSKPPHEKADLTFPVVMRGDWDLAARCCASLGHVTSFLRSSAGKSAHERARNHGDVTIGNMVVFNSCKDPHYERPLEFPSNLISLGLTPSMQRVVPDGVLAMCKELRMPQDDSCPTWSVQMSELISRARASDIDWFSKRRGGAKLNFSDAQSYHFEATPGVEPPPPGLQESNSTRMHKTDALAQNIVADQEYLDRVSVLLNHCQIVLCMPQVVHYKDLRLSSMQTYSNSDKAVFDSGLTLLLSGAEPATKTELLQIYIVSRSISGYLANIYGSVRMLAATVRTEVARESLSILDHAATNTLKSMAAVAPKIASPAHLLIYVIAGAVGYSKREKKPFRQDNRDIPWGELGSNCQSLNNDFRNVFFKPPKQIQFETENLDKIAVDVRFIPLVEELARNLSKRSTRDYKGTLKVLCDPASGLADILLSGESRLADRQAISRSIQELEGLDSKRMDFRGFRTIALLLDALRTPQSTASIALGDSGIERYENGDAPTKTVRLASQFELKLWHDAAVDAMSKREPFLYHFRKLDIQGDSYDHTVSSFDT